MAETTGIAWTRSTFNPWMLSPEALAAPSLPFVPDAVGLEVPKLVAGVAERDAIVDVVGQLRALAHRLLVVRSQVASAVIAAVPALITISREHRIAPRDVFGLASKAEIALQSAVPVGVVRISARRALARDGCDARPGFYRVSLTDTVRWPALRGFAHLAPRLNAHRGTLAHRGAF